MHTAPRDATAASSGDDRDAIAPRPLGHVPALDGLRALAVALVMLFHTWTPRARGGFLGVDLFFVLSGFLITSLLALEWERRGRIDLRRFYLRRALRLLPALLLLLALYLSLGPLVFADAPGLVDRAVDAALILGYVANWAQILNLHAPIGLGHTWSLAIEEQFYLVWPIVLGSVLARTRSRRAALAVTVALALASALVRVVLAREGASVLRLYYGSDTRADMVLCGCALALLLPDLRAQLAGPRRALLRPLLALASVVALGGIAVLTVRANWTYPWMYTWGFPLIALLAALLVLDGVSPGPSPVRSLLAQKPLVAIGRISYGLYLWHYPIFRALQAAGWSPLAVGIAGSTLTLAVAALSYALVERPCLGIKGRLEAA